MEVPSHASAYAALIAGFFMIVGSFVQWVFLRLLRNKHGKLWMSMGRPTIWTDQSLLTAWDTVKFIQNKQFVSLSFDASAIRFCRGFRLPLIGFYWGTFLSFIWLVISIIWLGWPHEWQ
jgi:hypothetical protein